MRALLVAHERGTARFIQQGLARAGYAVDVAVDGQAGLNDVLGTDYDVIILDIVSPLIDGLRWLREFRTKRLKPPVLFLFSREGMEERLEFNLSTLNLEANDYLVKPFVFSELLVRLRSLLRRPSALTDTLLQVGDLEMDTVAHQVRWHNQEIHLSVREFALLEYLMRHSGQVLTRAQIAQQVWNFKYTSDTKVIDVYIGYLRRKLNQGAAKVPIQTVRGVGYRLSL
ncbi:winged helix-turn-helix domain-containing protein [Thermocoleostomius sinensis]|jgi:DNA-binding response OmpR family regulator|uniref:Response regulator transcription factor n=1 Tax=Thermocoleostomius sinensis A174 TaxID=2016057 RepID=A0A9E8ZAL4_9CYAN|nr:response regulator transcription factor [Thermocoleostomius sinensis]WAL59650.1 response regulator transcription factor [Thermocoleostomius sinensis A174]